MAINSPLNIAAQPGKTRLRKSLKLWQVVMMGLAYLTPMTCLLYTSDAADEPLCVALGGPRINKKKKTHKIISV